LLLIFLLLGIWVYTYYMKAYMCKMVNGLHLYRAFTDPMATKVLVCQQQAFVKHLSDTYVFNIYICLYFFFFMYLSVLHCFA